MGIDLSDVSNEEIKKSFDELLKLYLSPAFGSISKRDFEIALFIELQRLGIIEDNVYEIIKSLKITKSKAHSLIYESKLRTTDEKSLKMEFQEIIKIQNIKNIEKNKIIIEVVNPYLRDFIKNEFRKLGSVVDTSFNSDILKFDIRDYLDLLSNYDTRLAKELNNYLKSADIIEIADKVTKLPLSKIIKKERITKLVDFVTNLKQGVLNDK